MIVTIPDFDPAVIAASGQCFRFTEAGENVWRIIARRRALTINALGGEQFELDCMPSAFGQVWADYFDLAADYSVYVKAARDAGDDYLTGAALHARGLRLLRQEPWEMLVSFIISQRKSIPAIRTCIERLSEAYGTKRNGDKANAFSDFPTPRQLARAGEAGLRACGLGYRAPYLLAAAQACAVGRLDLNALGELPDEALCQALMALPGVGPKVASCVMLFGYHRLDAFPKDVWILRALESRYPEGFPFEAYKGFNGVMQQYLFNEQIHYK